jgi:LysM repeat protein
VAIAVCNETNYHEFACHELADDTTFEAAGTALRVLPKKLREYNREIAGDHIAKGTRVRVPFDSCAPVVGAWVCYNVKAGDTLESVLTDHAPVRNMTMLRGINADALWGGSDLHPGMQLRLPLRASRSLPGQNPGCLPDGRTVDCHLVDEGETITSIAKQYGTTAAWIATSNKDVLGDVTSGTKLIAGVLLRVPACFFGAESSHGKCKSTPPPVCAANPSWTCYTVRANDTVFKIGAEFAADPYDVCDVNNLKNCSELQVGQVLTVPKETTCSPMPGFWSCVTLWPDEPAGTPIGWEDGTSGGTTIQQYTGRADLFCQLNKQLSDCRAKDGSALRPGGYSGMTVRVPEVHCFPDANSFCAVLPQTDPKTGQIPFPLPVEDKGSWVNWLGRPMGGVGPITEIGFYGDNQATFGWAIESVNSPWMCGYLSMRCMQSPVQVPRGSFLGPRLADCGSPPEGCGDSRSRDWCKLECVPTPGKHICHKPIGKCSLDPFGTDPCHNYDTLSNVAKTFGVEWKALCALNGMKNCSCLPGSNVAIKIPVQHD